MHAKKKTRTHRSWEEAGEINVPWVSGHGGYFLLHVLIMRSWNLIHFVFSCQWKKRSLSKVLKSLSHAVNVEQFILNCLWAFRPQSNITSSVFSYQTKPSSSVFPPGWCGCRPRRRYHVQPAAQMHIQE